MRKRKLLGHIGVDAGLCWLGDPCYVMGDGASSRVRSWKEFCGKLHRKERSSEPLGEGVGVAVSTGYGDGWYPVYGELNSEGRVAKVEVVFIKDGEED